MPFINKNYYGFSEYDNIKVCQSGLNLPRESLNVLTNRCVVEKLN